MTTILFLVPFQLRKGGRELLLTNSSLVQYFERGDPQFSEVCVCVCMSGHPLLQLRVVTCFLLLAGGRVINVFVPIFYKRIVDALTPSTLPGGNSTNQLDSALGLTEPTTGVTFPAVSLVLYVLLRFLQVSELWKP